MRRAVVAGHICLDIIPYFDRSVALTPGRLFEVGAATIGTGGAVSNTGVALHILGIPTTLVGKIGDDSFGESVQSVLRGHGESLSDGMVRDPRAVTSYTVVVNIPGRDRTFLHCPGANADFVGSDIDRELLRGAHLFHFGYPAYMAAMCVDTAAELRTMYGMVKGMGLTTSLDPGQPDASSPAGRLDWEAILTATLPSVDIFMPSADELLYALDRDRFGEGDALAASDIAPLAERLLAMGSAIVAVKLGARGIYLRTGSEARLATMGAASPDAPGDWADRELWIPVFDVPVVAGATGAGDTTIAGFLASLLRGLPIEEAGRMANAVGSCNVEAPDALGGLLSWDETLRRVEGGWAPEPLNTGEDGWREDPNSGIRIGPRDARCC